MHDSGRCVAQRGLQVLRPVTAAAAGLASDVVARLNVVEPVLAKQRLHRLSLVETVLQQQPASRFEVFSRSSDDAAQRAQAIAAGGQCQRRLVGERREVPVATGDVRGVAEHELKTTLWHGLPP